MKYIRTKKGIYDLQPLTISSYEKLVNTKVIKQADTIEDLCDGFYYDLGYKDWDYDDFYYKCDFKGVKEQFLENIGIFENQKVFGFIKTYKGLIYVAKMNDKGELELL